MNKLPVNEKTFSLNLTGDTTTNPYQGDFTVTCVPTLRQRSAQNLLEARLNAGLNIDQDVAGMHMIYSQLKTRLIKAPTWFTDSDYGMNLLDANIMLEVWRECQQAEIDYRVSLKPELAKEFDKEAPKKE